MRTAAGGRKDSIIDTVETVLTEDNFIDTGAVAVACIKSSFIVPDVAAAADDKCIYC